MIKTLKALQDVLGRHQDREVQIALLRSLGPEVGEATGGDAALMAIGALVARLGEDERAARGEFAGRFAEFASEDQRRLVKETFAMSASDFGHLPTTTYEADPSQVHRVLLLYSGGLDTSVMLKWIQEQYQAEVVALTVNLGQPGEDYEVIRGKALNLGALDCHVVDAREEFAREYIVPAIKANGIYGLGYPLFTALGRPLIAKLAVKYARESGCDTIAHGCTGKGNDQVRIDATVATLGPELKVIAPVRGWRMGREEEVAYAREHGIPIKGGTEIAPYSIDDNLWGRSSEGRWIEDLDHAPEDDVFQLVTRPEEAPDEAEIVTVEFEQGVPVALNGERLALVALLERAGEIGARHGVGIVDHIEDRIVGPEGPRHLRGARGGDPAARPPGAREARRHDPPEPAQADARPAMGVSRLRRPVVGSAPQRSRRLHGRRQLAGHRHDRDQAVQGLGAGGHALVAARGLRRAAGVVRPVRRAVRPGRVARVHRAVVAPVADGVAAAARTGGLSREPVGSFIPMGYKVLGYVVWQGGQVVPPPALARGPPKLALVGDRRRGACRWRSCRAAAFAH